MTEEELVDLIAVLGLSGEDVIHVDIDHGDPHGFSVLATEGERITHVMFGWGATGLYATVTNYVGLDNPAPVDDAVVVPLGGSVSIINPNLD